MNLYQTTIIMENWYLRNVLGNAILKNAAKIIKVFRTKDYLVLTMIDKYFSSELVQWVFFSLFHFCFVENRLASLFCFTFSLYFFVGLFHMTFYRYEGHLYFFEFFKMVLAMSFFPQVYDFLLNHYLHKKIETKNHPAVRH